MRRLARLLSLAGPLGIVVLLSKVHAAYIADPPYDYTGSGRFIWSILYATALAVAAYGVGLPDVPKVARGALAAALASSLIGALVVSVFQLAFGDALLPRFVVGGAAIACLPLQLLAWSVARRGRAQAQERDRVVVVGRSGIGQELEDELRTSSERPAVIVVVAEVDDVASDGCVPGEALVALVKDNRCGVVVLDRAALDDESVVRQAARLHEQGVRVRSVLHFYSQWLGKLPSAELERSTLFFDIAEIHRRHYARLKRLIDVVGSSIGVLLLVLLLPLVLLGNLVGNRGTLLYRQPRVGQNGRPFEILKFRTMRADPLGSTRWTDEGDSRVTPFGGLLRRTHLDELPQVVNIIRGDLSLVGPRPEQPHYVEELTQKLPFYGLRHLVRPGLTGWAQVKQGYVSDDDGSLEKLQYEFYYLQNQSLILDLRIIARTVRAVVGTMGGGR